MVIMRPHLYKNHLGNWVVAGTADEYPPSNSIHPRVYCQEESPKLGSYWMESGVNLTRAKITNSKEARPDQNMIYVYSMHYYMPRINIARLVEGNAANLELCGSYIIPGTQFYTVTAYQNPDVIKVKIKNNPFAKGFRNRQSDLQLLDEQTSISSHISNMHHSHNSPKSDSDVFGQSVNFPVSASQQDLDHSTYSPYFCNQIPTPSARTHSLF
ncbi:T-box brain protein 1 [Cichlidogyrus casuarinus]|uniref:T-box brain protein 1 n=1 Tax=Cichlidogyrus casuarinus TaxID=1844966 RepID=A0ABD2Q1R7_9PLAT